MGYHLRKQLTILFIIFFSLFLIGAWVYWAYFYVAPNCFDSKQNQDEVGVDCGGVCISCERTTIKQLKILWAKSYFLKDDFYDLAASVENPNSNYGLSEFNYVFKYYDSADNLLGEKRGVDFIMPRQTKYVVEGNISAKLPVSRVELIIDDSPKEKWLRLSNDFETPKIFAHSIKLDFMENGNAEVSGIIKNDSNYDFEKITAVVILEDSQKNIVGFNETEARTVMAGEDRYFAVLWFSKFSTWVERATVEISTNLFSQENFNKRYGVPEKFQEMPEATD
ncbi:MAG: hypothetical protein UV36_C0016G0002 [Parcubacteria group bacterium GW2011_GWC2_42_6]|nr:MAG: hypothetical protein UV36_C0016G0002 [Parcubacteria group bacterium GW2011_GWC2_42_6]